VNPPPIFHPLAERELLEAIDWYEQRARRLGADFLDRVIEGLELITAHPESSPVVLGRVRRKVLRQFPYSVIYSVRPSGIFVVAIAHQKRRSEYWKDRLRAADRG
jgi:plasmid stabilization system protein ParE